VYRTNCRREGATHAAAANPFFVTTIYNIIFRRIIRTYLRDCPGENGACSRICTDGDLLLLVAQRRFKPGRWLRRRGEYHLRGGIALSRIIIYYICVCVVVIGCCRLTRDLLHVLRSVSDDTIERWIFDRRGRDEFDSHTDFQ